MNKANRTIYITLRGRREKDYPYSLLGVSRGSKHCKGRYERRIGYDHTGYDLWKCDCDHVSGWNKI